MAIESKCLTPKAIYKMHLSEDQLLVQVEFGNELDLSEEEASLMEILIHNQLELVLSKFWPKEKEDENDPE